jgi:hypothetical protein
MLVRIWILFLLGCATTSPPAAREPGVQGNEADIHTLSGAYAGYRVERRARGQGPSVTVIGTGATPFPFHQDLNDRRLFEAFRREVVAVAAARSLNGSGDYLGTAFQLWVTDYRDVDAIVERLGAWLAGRNYRGTIVIEVMPPPASL